MTREEAKNYYLLNNRWDAINRQELFDLIDEIYDDFENKKCKNCKYFDYEEENYGFCMNNWWKKGNEVDGNLLRVEADFGCNKFEKLKD